MSVNPRETWRSVMGMNVAGELRLGPNTLDRYLMDPKRIGFYFARYAAAVKFLRKCDSILDIGCGDGLASLVFLNDTNATRIEGIDFDEDLIGYAKSELMPALAQARPNDKDRISFHHRDFMMENDHRFFAGICTLDVVEHLDPKTAHQFFLRVHNSLTYDGIAVVGTPNKYAEQYASEHSRIGHINTYTPERLRKELEEYFSHVWIFSVNDSVVHLGFDRMAHYLLALCVKG